MAHSPRGTRGSLWRRGHCLLHPCSQESYRGPQRKRCLGQTWTLPIFCHLLPSSLSAACYLWTQLLLVDFKLSPSKSEFGKLHVPLISVFTFSSFLFPSFLIHIFKRTESHIFSLAGTGSLNNNKNNNRKMLNLFWYMF